MSDVWDPPEDPLAALRDGDSGPFEELVRRGAGDLTAFFRRLGATLDEAEDMAQDTFIKLYRAAPRYRSEERLAPYCFRVARNVWIDARRRHAVRPRATSLSAPDDEAPLPEPRAELEPPGARLERAEEIVRLQTALAELPEPHRLVFELGALQELPYADVASALDVPVGTVKSRMFHAVRKLRAALGSGDEQEEAS